MGFLPQGAFLCHQNMAANLAKRLFAARGNAMELTGISEQGTQRASRHGIPISQYFR